MSGTDVVAATQISTGTGGGRIATLGAVVGFCLSGLGAGTVCVVTGVIELPLSPAPKAAPAPKKKPAPKLTPGAEEVAEPRAEAPAPDRRHADADAARRAQAGQPRTDAATAIATTRATADPAPSRTRRPRRSPSQESAPPEFTFEQPAPTQSQPTTPAAAPATGGGEFAP